MEEKTAGDPVDSDGAADDLFRLVLDLPSLTKRWTVRRKAAVIEAVRGGWVPIEEVCRLYNLSVNRLIAACTGPASPCGTKRTIIAVTGATRKLGHHATSPASGSNAIASRPAVPRVPG